MSTPIGIRDPADPRLDDYRTLREGELRKRYEHEAGVFIAESPNVVRELLRSTYRTKSLLVTEAALAQLRADLDGVGVPIYVADRALIDEVVSFPLHQGAIAVGHRRADPAVAPTVAAARTLLALEEMNDPENMGVVFRSARALGVDAVLLGPRCSDPLYRRCVRVSMGHVLHVPFTTVPDLFGAVEGFTTVALAPSGSVTLEAFAARRPERVALLVGAEGPGLTDAAFAAADVEVRIPMEPGVDSLNVGTAVAIALQALRAGRPHTTP